MFTKKMKEKNENIIIKNARVHNLKGIDLEIPRNKFIVITGLRYFIRPKQ